MSHYSDVHQSLLNPWHEGAQGSAYLDTDVVTELDVLDKGPALHNNTSTFVSTDKGELDGQRPVTVHGMEIGVADTRELDVNQNFIWANFWNWDLLIDTGWVMLVFFESSRASASSYVLRSSQ